MTSTGNGLKSFAFVAALFLAISLIRLEPASDAGTVSTTGAGAAAEEFVEEGGGEVVTDPAAATAAGPAAPGAAAPTRRTATKAGTGTAAAAGPAAAAPGASTGAGSGGGAAVGGGTRGSGGSGTKPDGSAVQCAAGKNGGATDKGVTATKIRLATTAVLDGPAKSLLEPSVTAMKAVRDKVNREGGICGRQLELTVVNDSFVASDGHNKIKNFIAEDYFALPVVPSAEGLGSAITAGDIKGAGIPVIGTDGMRNEQYEDPWVWPVASATVTSMRVMAKHGWDKGARSFAIVYDEKYQFGKEGKDAFVAQVKAMGGNMVTEQPLNPSAPAYGSEAGAFNSKCGDNKCDMVAMLLLPDTGAKWMARQPALGKVYTAGAQTLFTNRFAQDCVQSAGGRCHGIAIWTGYNPPIGPIAAKPGVAQYRDDVRALDPGIDVTNQFLEGAYLGMTVFVEALKKVGPNLTRAALRDAMDSMSFQTDLASTLTWQPGKHAANVRSQAFSMDVTQNTFNGWKEDGTGFLLDPAHGG